MDSQEMVMKQAEDEKAVKWVYNWLFWSPIITVPWLIINSFDLGSRDPLTAFIWATITPAIPHLVLLSTQRSKHLFIRRHGQQALLLISTRIFSTVFFLGSTRFEDIGLWLAVNGFLWLFGRSVGLKQITEGDSWLMRYLGEKRHLPRPWKDLEPFEEIKTLEKQAASVPSLSKRKLPALQISSWAPNAVKSANERGLQLLKEGKKTEALEKFLFVFREGPKEWKEHAIESIRNIDEIEVF